MNLDSTSHKFVLGFVIGQPGSSGRYAKVTSGVTPLFFALHSTLVAAGSRHRSDAWRMTMRVPIHPQDLNGGSGFSRLAKCLKRDWPGTDPLRLSEAQNLLARCFGYTDYHDLRSSALEEDIDYPPLMVVTSQCLATLSGELITGGRSNFFNLGEFQSQIFDWPFLQLQVYRNHYGHSDNRLVAAEVRAEVIEAFLSTQKTRPVLQPYEHRPLAHELSTHNLRAMVRHYSIASNPTKVTTLAGTCPNHSPHDANQFSIPKVMPCMTCGPAKL